MTIVTPMMRQYQAIKEQYGDCLLFFRLGDFYELFAEDALTASQILNIVLTARDGGNGQKVPMCGVPHHAANNYIAKLIAKGHKVAICEQLEDPKTVKGLVKRDVIRVITPGTVLEEQMLEDKRHNYLACVWRQKGKCRPADAAYGLAYADISSGELLATQIEGYDSIERLAGELGRIQAAELLLPQALYDEDFFRLRMLGNCVGSLSHVYEDAFIENNYSELLRTHFKLASLEALGLEEKVETAKAVAAILDFLQQTQKRSLPYIDRIRIYDSGQFMFLDAATRRNLELTQTLRGGNKRGSLLWVLDHTLTAMGGRLLRDWIENPLLTPDMINRRNSAIEELLAEAFICDDIRELLKVCHDLPRLIGRICYGSASPRDLLALKQSLRQLPELFTLLGRLRAPFFALTVDNFDELADIAELIEAAVADDAPLSAKDSGVVRGGYNADVDHLRELAGSAQRLLIELEARERERSGIRNLKVRYNKVFGYYIEISKSRSAEAPADYIRKQTLVNGERFITEELKQLESNILSASERLSALEYQLFCELRERIAEQAARIQTAAEILANIDVLQALTQVASANNYCKPLVDDSDVIDINQGRHAVIERIIGEENYVANDTHFDNEQRMMLITGPNMAGKSTYMRQVALIVLLAHIGSYVPAVSAHIGCVDRIFTRVGASDDLSAGQSTFLVEMNETSNILRHATRRSLVLLDEIGRGTSTLDGLSIAWAVAEYMAGEDNCAKTMFATHYHELTALHDSYRQIVNYSIAVMEKGKDIIFLRKIMPGGTDKSYGIQVARLAGLPQTVIKRAREILNQLEAEKHIRAKLERGEQITFTDILLGEQTAEPEAPQLAELRELDIEQITPMEALNLLHRWKKEL
ncbi:MAG: DNA mismatch repair protein MutS [Bacillota bacterium]|nr:DNA mismatch repair protein MutS [Bacillota bacterium]